MSMANVSSIVCITSSDPDKNDCFGTGAVIAKTGGFVYVVTCDHVIQGERGVGKDTILVKNLPADLIELRYPEDDVDLAIIRIADTDDTAHWRPFPLTGRVPRNGEVAIYIPQDQGGEEYATDRHQLSGGGILYSKTHQRVYDRYYFTSVWRRIKGGDSGAPVLTNESLCAVVRAREEGNTLVAHAIPLYSLLDLWPDIPDIIADQLRDHSQGASDAIKRPLAAEIRSDVQTDTKNQLAEKLATEADPQKKEALLGQIQEIDRKREDLKSICDRDSDTYHLFVFIDSETQVDPDRLLMVCIHVPRDRDKHPHLIQLRDTPSLLETGKHLMASFTGYLDEIIDHELEKYGDRPARVDLIVPNDLLLIDFDQAALCGESMVLGCDYAFVLRQWDRVMMPGLWQRVKERFKPDQALLYDDTVLDFTSRKPDMRSLTFDHKEVVGALFRRLPELESEIRPLLFTGLSFLLVHRTDGPSSPDLLKKCLNNIQLSDLPKKIQKQRQSGDPSENQLTLIYDDADYAPQAIYKTQRF